MSNCNDWIPQRWSGHTGWQTWAQPLGWPLSQSADVSQRVYGGVIFVILAKGKPVPLAWEIIYMNGEVMRVTSTILPKMGLKCVTEA